MGAPEPGATSSGSTAQDEKPVGSAEEAVNLGLDLFKKGKVRESSGQGQHTALQKANKSSTLSRETGHHTNEAVSLGLDLFKKRKARESSGQL